MNLKAIFGNSGDGVYAIDGGGVIRFWNSAAQEILGYSFSEVQGKHCRDLFKGRDASGNRLCSEICWVKIQAMEGVPVRHFEMQTTTAKGSAVWLDISVLRIPASVLSDTLAVYMFRDVTASHYVKLALQSGPKAVQPIQISAANSEVSAVLNGLTARQNEVLSLLKSGASTTEIGDRLGISLATVRNHIQGIFARLGVHSRTEMLAVLHGFKFDKQPAAELEKLAI
ncbi:Probable regulator, LuxR family [gamma proteobacterium HdN1]|nr:Probable regulator, LuxR family [gamma proteobacterium HdN1]